MRNRTLASFALRLGTLGFATLFAGCLAAPEDLSDTETSREEGVTVAPAPTAVAAVYNVDLYNEGTCRHLACASCCAKPASGTGGFQCSNARSCTNGPAGCNAPLPAGRYHPSFYCKSPDTTCNDNDLFLSVPVNRPNCDATYAVCYNGRVRYARVKDRSFPNTRWEASIGLQQQLGMALGANARVRIYTNQNDPNIALDPTCVPQTGGGGGGSVDCSCGASCNGATNCAGMYCDASNHLVSATTFTCALNER